MGVHFTYNDNNSWCFLSLFHVPVTVLRASRTLTHLILTETYKGQHLHSADEETETLGEPHFHQPHVQHTFCSHVRKNLWRPCLLFEKSPIKWVIVFGRVQSLFLFPEVSHGNLGRIRQNDGSFNARSQRKSQWQAASTWGGLFVQKGGWKESFLSARLTE